ncbi:MAG TPA: OmpA family protein [Kofleriaceae bacterium]|jgi:outer membrane protein OmpA-like peptidoglycan-associated protein
MKSIAFTLCAVLAVAGCAHTQPSQELVDARSAYDKAANDPNTTNLVPADLHIAHEALERAERTYQKDPGSQDERDLAYIAMRKAQRAETLGIAAAGNSAEAQAEAARSRTQDQIITAQRGEIRNARGEVAMTQDALDRQRTETQNERAARIAAEKKAQDAMDALSKSLAVKNDDRGTIITLSAGVLFATNQSMILPGAQAQLNQVADALKTQAEHHFVVLGHTDTQGNDAINDPLSQRRADAVKDYLIVHGVAADAISARGMGSHSPVADNHTTEGRAMNRRVEIIVDHTPPQAASNP